MAGGSNTSACSEELQALSLKIFGEPASKANSRKIARIGNISRLIKSKKALSYSDAFKAQCTAISPLMSGDVRITMRIFYASRRPDLDESLILDLLQDIVYINDRQVKEKHVYWGLDKETPRTEMLIEQIPKVQG